jgi:Rrf2 family protein
MISRQAKYALRALIALARAGGESLLTADIARQQKIPKRFLEQILLVLKRQGLVQSRRGARGGYTLLKPANAITFAEVLRLIDGPMAPLPCLSVVAYARCADCADETTCEIRRVFARVAEATRERLELTTIAQAIREDSTPADRPAADTKNYSVTV